MRPRPAHPAAVLALPCATISSGKTPCGHLAHGSVPLVTLSSRNIRVSLNEKALNGIDLFRIRDMTLGQSLFCSETFKEVALGVGLEVEFIPVETAAEVYHERHPL